MKNLKRALSLALASVMVLGMMVVGAGAAEFNDVDDIKNTEAVNTMVALGVIKGKDTGDFDPEGIVTRAEMAKMICVILNGGRDPQLGTTVAAFPDTANHWANSYVAFCANQGIVAGDNHGNFNPDASVTGTEAAKMILTALGYKSEVEGYVGANWAIATNVKAGQLGIYDDTNVTASEALSRDNAAQMLYNALECDEMYYMSAVTVDGVAIGNSQLTSREYTLLTNRFKAAMKYGYMTARGYDETKGEWTYTFTNVGNFGSTTITGTDALAGTVNLTTKTDYTGLFGMKVRVIYKDADTVYGVYASESKVVASGVAGDIGTIDTTAKTVKINGTAYKFDNTISCPIYNIFDAVATGETIAELKDNSNSFSFNAIDNDGDNKVDAIIKTPVKIARITYKGSDSITVNAPVTETFKVEDINIYEGYAKNDWVIFTDDMYSTTEIDTLEKAEVSTGTITGIRTGEYMIDGSWYEGGNNNNVAAGLNINDQVEYVAMGGYLYYAKVTESGTTTKDIASVITVGKKGTATDVDGEIAQAKLIFTDGSKKTVTIAKMDGDEVGSASIADVDAMVTAVTAKIGDLVTYKVDSNGKYELTSMAAINQITGNLAGYKGSGDATTYSNKKVGGYELADDAVVFVVKRATANTANAANDGKLYSGRELKNAYGTNNTFGAAGYSLYNMVNGFNYAKVAVIENTAFPTITNASNYGYLVANAYHSYENDKNYINFKFWDGTTEVEAKEESTDPLTAYKSGVIITYDNKAAGEIKNVSVVTATLGIVKGWDGNKSIQLDTVTREINSDTVLLFVNSKDKKGVVGDIDNISIGDDTIGGDDVADVANVRYVNGATYVNLLVVDVENKMLAAPVSVLEGNQADDTTVTTALASASSVYVNGTLTTDGLAVGEGKTLTVTGALTATGDITGAGTLVVNSFSDAATSAAFVKTAHVKLTAAINDATLAALAATKTITLTVETSNNVSTATNFYATGTSAVTGAKVPVGTYTYYAANSIPQADGVGVATHSAGWFTEVAATAVAATNA